jgi:dolichyl-phosphate-mannose-protein mannosyltransferase
MLSWSDPILLFFISGAAYAMVHFRTLVNQPFTTQWWLWLSITGLMLAGK